MGASDLMDSDLFLRKSQQDPLLRILKRVKSRNSEEQDGAALIRLNPDTLWFELVDGNVNEGEHVFDPDSPKGEINTMKQLARRLHAEGLTMQQIGDRLAKTNHRSPGG